MTYRITAVCLGNICRSPMAEAVLAARVRAAGFDDIAVDSAGTGSWHVGHDADPRARSALAARGYPLRHTARQFAPEWFEPGHPQRADLVLAMDSDNLAALRRLAPDGVDTGHVLLLRTFDDAVAHRPPGHSELGVPDPYYGDDAGFDAVLDMIEAAVDGLVDRLPALRAR